MDPCVHNSLWTSPIWRTIVPHFDPWNICLQQNCQNLFACMVILHLFSNFVLWLTCKFIRAVCTFATYMYSFGNLGVVKLFLYEICLFKICLIYNFFFRLSFSWHQMKKITFQLMKKYSGMRYEASCIRLAVFPSLWPFHILWELFEQKCGGYDK